MTLESPDLFEKWWPRVRDVASASIGAYLLLVVENLSTAKLTLAGALLVVPVASLASHFLRGFIFRREDYEDFDGR